MKREGEQLVLDTNILVHVLRGKQHGQMIVDAYGLLSRRPRPIVPVVVAGEIKSFARYSKWQEDKLAAIDSLLSTIPTADISSPDVIELYAKIDSASQLTGRSMGKNDAWIAAVTAVSEATLVTTDKDFEHLRNTWISIEYIDPESLKAGKI